MLIKSKFIRRAATLMATALLCLTAGTATASAADGARGVVAAKDRLVASGDGWALYMDGAAAGQMSPTATNECGVVRCTLYFNRRETVRINNNINLAGGGVGGLVASCGIFGVIAGPPGVIAAVSCGASVAIYGGLMLNAISNAARTNACFATSYGVGGPRFSVNRTSKCRN